MKQLKIRISTNQEVAADCYRLSFAAPAIARWIKPGQFFHLRLSGEMDPLLRRPFSLHRLKSRVGAEKTVEILYQVVGRGTRFLSQKKPGEIIDVLGPLGNGFSLPVPGSRFILLVGGGIGVAPLYALAEEIVQRKGFKRQKTESRSQKAKIRLYVLIGEKRKDSLLCIRDFARMGVKVFVSTEDGSAGEKGLVTDLLKQIMGAPELASGGGTVYACGPRTMLKEVTRIARRKNFSCQVSLEEMMACGVGACRGCVVKVHSPQSTVHGPRSKSKNSFIYKTVCKDGPVFDAEEIVWD